jgi:hypothetical protein
MDGQDCKLVTFQKLQAFFGGVAVALKKWKKYKGKMSYFYAPSTLISMEKK